jgi:hypothetical protein
VRPPRSLPTNQTVLAVQRQPLDIRLGHIDVDGHVTINRKQGYDKQVTLKIAARFCGVSALSHRAPVYFESGLRTLLSEISKEIGVGLRHFQTIMPGGCRGARQNRFSRTLREALKFDPLSSGV